MFHTTASGERHRGGRILFLTPDLAGSYGGIAYHATVVLKALLRAGFDVTAIALHDRGQSLGLADGSAGTLQYTPCAGRRPAFLTRSFTSLFRRPRIVIVEHAHFAPLGWLLARASRARLVVFCHGIEVWDRLPGVRGTALRHADLLLCVSHCTAQRVTSANGVQRARVRVIHSCLDPDTHPAGGGIREAEPATLLTVGRLARGEKYKGHDRVIRALARLKPSFPGVKYEIVGEGDWRPELEMLARAEGVEGDVTFLGAISDDQLAASFQRAAVYVMPSRGEGFGITFLQAMAHGLPVVAGGEDASPEVVIDRETGYVVDPDDVGQLTDRLATLLRNPDLRHAMGTRGAEVVAARFGFERFASELTHVLREAGMPVATWA